MNDDRPDCARHDDIVLLAYGELPPDERRELLLHLDGCAPCRASFAELVAVRTGYESIPKPRLDPAERTRLMSNAAPPVRAAVSRGWMLAAAASIAAAGFLAGLATAPAPDSSERLAAVESELRELRGERLRLGVEHPSAVVRLQQVHFAAAADGVAGVLLDVLAHDPNPNVRLAALDALGRVELDASQAETLMSRLLAEPSPLLRAALVEFVANRELEGSRPLLRQLERSDEDASVREKARSVLERRT